MEVDFGWFTNQPNNFGGNQWCLGLNTGHLSTSNFNIMDDVVCEAASVQFEIACETETVCYNLEDIDTP